MTANIVFACPLPPRGLRTNRATKHAAYHARLTRAYAEQVWCAGDPVVAPWDDGLAELPWEHATLRLTWRHAGVAPDEDNALHSLKALIDVLHTRSARPLGIVVDDAPAHLTIARVRTEKVAHRRDECVLVEVEEGA